MKRWKSKYKLAIVYWLDACGGHRQGWRSINEVSSAESAPVASVGFVVREDKNTIVVCPHLTEDELGDGEIAIPKQWVKQVRFIE